MLRTCIGSSVAAVALCAGSASAGITEVYTFDAPNFMFGENTPLSGRAPNITSGAGLLTDFTTSGPPATVFDANFFPLNGLFTGQFLVMFDRGNTLTLTFNTPVQGVSFDFGLNGTLPGFTLVVTSSNGVESIPATNVGGGNGMFGGTYTSNWASPVTTLTIHALEPNFGELIEFGIDNLAVTVPTPGAAALLGLGGLVAGRRRRM
jgi:hypothetical protein